MRFRYKSAFSLTELLIVLAIVAIIFAAVTPIVTRRVRYDLTPTQPVWQYLKSDPEASVYFDSEIPEWNSCLFAGENRDERFSEFDNLPGASSSKQLYDDGMIKNCAKFNIRARGQQNHLELRYTSLGDTRINGTQAAFIKMNEGRGILLYGSDISFSPNSMNNIIAGLTSFSNTGCLRFSTLVGNNVAKGAVLPEDGCGLLGTMIGNNAGAGAVAIPVRYARGVGEFVFFNTYIGESAGAGAAGAENNRNNIAIGAKAMSIQTHGQRNAFVGSGVGNRFGTNEDEAGAVYDNSIVGSRFTGGGSRNTIIGYGSYHRQGNNTSNMTVIGYGACDAVSPVDNLNTSSFTCIGYNSGSTGRFFDNDIENSGQHIYIGGPSNSFGGRAPLEIHHLGNDVETPIYSRGRATVVLNSNLVVRNNLYVHDPNEANNGRVYRLTVNNAGNNEYNFTSGGVCNPLNVFERNFCEGSPNFISSFDSNQNFWLHPTYRKGEICKDGYEHLSNCGNIISDERLKENIVINNEGLEQVLSLVPYNYTFKNDDAKTPQVGVIAQDLQKIFPNSVSKGSDGYYRIRWDEMFYAVINAIKTLSAKIEAITADVLNLEHSVKYLKSANKSAKKEITSLNKRLNNLEKKYRSSK